MFTEVFTPNSTNPTQISSNVLTAGAASQRLAVCGNEVIRLVNAHATQTVHINFGDGTESAISGQDMIVPPAFGKLEIRIPQNARSMSYIASGAATPLYYTKGV